MCEPTTLALASLAITGVGAVVQHNAGVVAYNREQSALNDQLAADLNAGALQSRQAAEQSAQEMSDRALEAQRHLALIQTVSGEYGGGNSSDRLAVDAVQARGADLATLAKNRDNTLLAIGQDTANRGLATLRTKAALSAPSVAGLALKISAAGLDSYGAYKRSTTPTPSKAGNGP